MTLSPDVVAVQLLGVAGPIEAAGRTAPRLVLLPAPFRETEGPAARSRSWRPNW